MVPNQQQPPVLFLNIFLSLRLIFHLSHSALLCMFGVTSKYCLDCLAAYGTSACGAVTAVLGFCAASYYLLLLYLCDTPASTLVETKGCPKTKPERRQNAANALCLVFVHYCTCHSLGWRRGTLGIMPT